MGQLALDIFAGTNEIHGVVVVFVDAGGDRKDVGVEDNIFRREADLFGEDPVSTAADLNFSGAGIRLTHFVKRHDHHRRTVTPDLTGMMNKGRFTLFHRN